LVLLFLIQLLLLFLDFLGPHPLTGYGRFFRSHPQISRSFNPSFRYECWGSVPPRAHLFRSPFSYCSFVPPFYRSLIPSFFTVPLPFSSATPFLWGADQPFTSFPFLDLFFRGRSQLPVLVTPKLYSVSAHPGSTPAFPYPCFFFYEFKQTPLFHGLCPGGPTLFYTVVFRSLVVSSSVGHRSLVSGKTCRVAQRSLCHAFFPVQPAETIQATKILFSPLISA